MGPGSAAHRSGATQAEGFALSPAFFGFRFAPSWRDVIHEDSAKWPFDTLPATWPDRFPREHQTFSHHKAARRSFAAVRLFAPAVGTLGILSSLERGHFCSAVKQPATTTRYFPRPKVCARHGEAHDEAAHDTGNRAGIWRRAAGRDH